MRKTLENMMVSLLVLATIVYCVWHSDKEPDCLSDSAQPEFKDARVISDQPIAFVLVANTDNEMSFSYSSIDLPVYAVTSDRDLCSVLKLEECYIRSVRFTRPGVAYVSTMTEPMRMVFYGSSKSGDAEVWIDEPVRGRLHVVGEELEM